MAQLNSKSQCTMSFAHLCVSWVVCCSVCTVCATDTNIVDIWSLHLGVHWFTQGQGHHCWPIGESC